MDSPGPTTNWFLAQIKPNSHSIAKRNLVQQGFETFLPLQEENKRSQGRFVMQMRPLFPGYLFVALDSWQGRWRAVNSTHGISRLVSLGAKPTPVPSELVNQLMQRCDAEGRLQPPKLLKAGDKLTLSKGPFLGFVATVESIAPNRRICVLLDIMGGQKRVEISADQLPAF